MVETAVDYAQELFGYNRKGYFFDAELRQEREYWEQDMRVKQFLLYREDIRDLMELTTGKMDSYLLVSLLELGCCVQLLVEGVLHDVPTWLLWLYLINLAGAFLYLFMSCWFAIHASVTAHSFGVRLLTQFVRLPLPNRKQLDAARNYAAEFEADAESMLRIPVLMTEKQQRQQAAAATPAASSSSAGPNMPVSSASMAPSNNSTFIGAAGAPSAAGQDNYERDHDSAVNFDPWATGQTDSLKHIRLYRGLQHYWQAHDAYARACLALGTYMLIEAMAYYSIGLFVVSHSAPWPALACVFALFTLEALIMRLDLYFKRRTFVIGSLFLLTGPLLTLLGTTFLCSELPGNFRQLHVVLIPVVFLIQASLIFFIASAAARAEQVGADSSHLILPTRFRAVLYLDVFGWLGDPSQYNDRRRRASPAQPRREGERVSLGKEDMPLEMRLRLAEDCKRMEQQLRLELEAWESAANAQTLKESGLVAKVRAVRVEVNALSQQLQPLVATAHALKLPNTPVEGSQASLMGGSTLSNPSTDVMGSGHGSSILSAATGSSSRHEKRQQGVWLRYRLELTAGVMETFFQPATRSTATTRDLPPHAVISDLSTFGDRLDFLRTKMSHLTFAQKPATQLTGFRGRFLRKQGSDGLSTVGSTTAPGSMAPTSMAASSMAPATMEPQEPISFDSVPEEGTAEGVGLESYTPAARPAQEMHFGGAEGVAAGLQQRAGMAALQEVAAQTFHPRRDGRLESRRPVGQVPWITFFAASMVLVSVWTAGIFYYAIMPALDVEELDGICGRRESPKLRSDKHEGDLVDQRPLFLGALGEAPMQLSGTLGSERLTVAAAGEKRILRPVSMACVGDDEMAWLLVERYGVYVVGAGETASLSAGGLRVEAVDRCLERAGGVLEHGLHSVELEQQGQRRVLKLYGRTEAGYRRGQGIVRCPLDDRQWSRHLRAVETNHTAPCPSAKRLWRLPEDLEIARWKRSCEIAGHLYALGSTLGEASPELWRLRLPCADEDDAAAPHGKLAAKRKVPEPQRAVI
eukprot:TRINITY_DN121186_c0_g1_i1.p1 TRINITY_DN121186_c0_g1~~TRINITY_DN121186_c0_g1_i1.p1  ORF type:complete len:1034 (+),score=246.27 TRINITY_DN121186_c0_g1_i1:167-3268(+)